jgi:hypothetical protein
MVAARAPENGILRLPEDIRLAVAQILELEDVLSLASVRGNHETSRALAINNDASTDLLVPANPI